MVVGIAIALFQALTQVQEMTLTFVPKIVVILAGRRDDRRLHRRADLAFTELVYSRIENGLLTR